MTANAFARRRARIVTLVVFVALTMAAVATPWAEPLRRIIRPELPLVVLILGGASAVAQLVTGVAGIFSNKGARRSAALLLTLGASALCMALAFLPRAIGAAVSFYLVAGAAFLALTAAALQRRAQNNSEIK